MQNPLHSLALRLGIIPEYLDQSGTELRRTTDETRVALLAAMGMEASTGEAAERALGELERQERERLIAPVRVITTRDRGRSRVEIGVPDEAAGPVHIALELHEEGGAVHRAEGEWRRRSARTFRYPLPVKPQPGYYALRLTLSARGMERSAEQRLIVTPPACPSPRQLLGGRKAMGIIANLYTLRSERNWGIGNLGDLRELLAWTGEIGGDFVGVNPLHALRNRGIDISPYSPVSRVYRNPLYLDVEAVPELVTSTAARALLAREEVRAELRAVRAGDRVQYERVAALERPVLEALHRTFMVEHRDSDTERGRAYRDWVDGQGASIAGFATFMALSDHFADSDSWYEWPEPYRNPESPEVTAFREAHAEAVDFHRWVQFELERQLGQAARTARESGLAIGLYQDLAIGISPSGSDTWASPHLFARDVSIGAPPDDYSATGQNWGLPPLNPLRLYEDGYRYWTNLVRASLRHAGALRIDHVIGLFRQFWIPNGRSGHDGAYVKFPVDDLLAILALESTRAGALVVGEDLGTVPREVPGTLKRWSILSSRVLYFERTKRGGYRAPSRYEPLSLTTANTHDMATLAGFWQGRDIELKRGVGLIESDDEMQEAKRAREQDRRALMRALSDARGRGRGVRDDSAALT
ncbi:MAG TPA: 4-alpha-glucanotransferase, partial [Gemmatimonadaceae bacterium]|nr:4-alpha-glucanotransferase [Gemmatimonadaceae bacterium]